MIKIRNLKKSYGKKEILRGINLDLDYGIYALLGPNGAGKTTLLNILTRVIPASSGTVSIDNVEISKSKTYLEGLGYLPQAPSFYTNYNATEMLTYLGYLKNMNKSQIQNNIPNLLKAVNLQEVGNKKIGKYSGGMKQRLGIAQCIMNNPKVLILDEPTAGLDPKERMRFRNLIASLSNDKVVIVATHIVSDIENLANTIILINDGEIITKGTANELCASIQGKVYEYIGDSSESFEGLNISKLNYQGNRLKIRIVGNEPPMYDFKEVEPTLEDVYLFNFGDSL